MNVKSVSIMGKAGILTGEKGDIMIPTSHIFEGTADNYPFENALKLEDFQDDELRAFEGSIWRKFSLNPTYAICVPILTADTSTDNKKVRRIIHGFHRVQSAIIRTEEGRLEVRFSSIRLVHIRSAIRLSCS